jgi:ZIP family zinc transporter
MILIVGIFAACATLIGGACALYLKDQFHLILGFSAGAVIGVALFDLLPEAIGLTSLSYTPFFVLKLTAIGFATYLMLDRFFFLHTHEDHTHEHGRVHDDETQRGILGAIGLSMHSVLDGLAMGFAYQIATFTHSYSILTIITIGILAHDFSDGVNTVSMIVRHKGSRTTAWVWLCVDAVAPVIGIIITFFVSVSQTQLGLVLAVFAGFFLYIGASDLIPESFHEHPVRWTTFSTILGMASLYAVMHLVG